MEQLSSTDKQFLDTVDLWFHSSADILMLICYSRAGGAKSFEFFNSFAELLERLRGLAPETRVTVFRGPQLRLRGEVDNGFISKCLSSIPDGSEFVVVETLRRTAGDTSWFHDEAGESHAELRETLEALQGKQVAVGEYPPWLENSPDVISVIVPDGEGMVRQGIY